MDPDLPLDWERRLIRGNAFLKFLWLNIYPAMYVVRGLMMQKKPQFWELVNWAFTITTDALIWYFCGLRGLIYLFISLWLGYGIHPAAAHFIQEHYTFDDGQETYSYYGILNFFFLSRILFLRPTRFFLFPRRQPCIVHFIGAWLVAVDPRWPLVVGDR